MVSHAMWKNWQEGLRKQKTRPKAPVFVVTEARGHVFLMAWETMITSYEVKCQKIDNLLLTSWFLGKQTSLTNAGAHSDLSRTSEKS